MEQFEKELLQNCMKKASGSIATHSALFEGHIKLLNDRGEHLCSSLISIMEYVLQTLYRKRLYGLSLAK